MAMTIAEIEQRLSVGIPITVQFLSGNFGAANHKSSIRGWQPGQYVILDQPVLDDRPLSPPHDEPCSLCFLSEGVVCGFKAAALTAGAHAVAGELRVSWPTELTMVRVRKHERAVTAIRCSVCVGESTERQVIELHDVSIGGCSLLFSTELPVGARIRIWCVLPDGFALDGVNVTVRRRWAVAEGVLHGCRFDAPEPGLQDDIQFLVADTLERLRTPDNPLFRVLIIDPREAVTDAINAEVSKKGYRVVAAHDIIDGFYRLRANLPRVLLLAQEQVPLSGIEICRLVKGARGFHALPVIIYGRKADLGDLAKSAGAVGYFTTEYLTEQVAHLVQEGGPFVPQRPGGEAT